MVEYNCLRVRNFACLTTYLSRLILMRYVEVEVQFTFEVLIYLFNEHSTYNFYKYFTKI